MSKRTTPPGLTSNSAPAFKPLAVESLIIATLFPTVDECGDESDDMSGDYCAVAVEINGEEVARFGDHYHDKGRDKAEGFVSGFLKAIELVTGQTPAVEAKYAFRLDESVNV